MKVKIYTTETCQYCKALKEFLKEHNVEYDEVDVGKDEEARKYIFEKSGRQGVPQIEVNGKIIVGFEKEQIAKELGIK